MSKQNGPMGGLLCSKHLCIPVMHHRMRNSWVIRKSEHLGESAESCRLKSVCLIIDSPGSASILFSFFDGGEKIISTTTGRGGKKRVGGVSVGRVVNVCPLTQEKRRYSTSSCLPLSSAKAKKLSFHCSYHLPLTHSGGKIHF